MLRSSFIVVGALALAALLPSTASAEDTAFAQITGQPHGRVTVNVEVRSFKATASGPRARGVATATLRRLGGTPTTVKRRVEMAVSKRGSCKILTLQLDTLDLTLLGLNVHLDKVDLRVTGRRHGGVLGRLFCSLAGAKVKPARAAAARLNHRLHRTGRVRPMRVTVPVQAVAAQARTCKVLELTLGPLNVNLLGLVVDLKRVHLTITATPGGGTLGDLFCGLANSP